ncbi:MAG TPA: hypothetical protein VFW87_00565 [Pirellulales bacterium]|nr:hypothetical protein [Pirellulales bacterium]
MNLVGKIFVVLIFVMSLVFMGFSVVVYATHKNWQEVIDGSQGRPGLKAQLSDAKAQVNDLQSQLKKLQEDTQTETQARTTRLAQLQTDYSNLKTDRDTLVNQLAGLTTQTREALESGKIAQDMLDEKLKEIDRLRTEIQQAHEDRDQRFKDAVALTDKLHEAEGEAERLKAYTDSLVRLAAMYRDAADRLGVDIHQPVDDIPPKLDGVVLASRSDGLVEISMGSDDGLRKGHQAYIYRQQNGQSRPIAKIEVVKVTPDKSVGKVIPEFRLAPIARDDRVATRLN